MEQRVIVFKVESAWLKRGEKRLNASSFSPETAKVMHLIDELRFNSVEISKVGDMVNKIFYPPRFKRHYSSSGVRFLSSKDIFDILLKGKIISNEAKNYMIGNNWLLVTRSGSVGRVLIANKNISSAAISEHVIRIVPRARMPMGYLYAYLKSSIGQALLIKNIFGGVVDEIEPQHIANIPIPRKNNLEMEINKKIRRVFKLREESANLLQDAIEKLHSELHLPHLIDDIEQLGDKDNSSILQFKLKASEIDKRLDASYHIPIFHRAKQNLTKNKFGQVLKLGDIAESFVPPRFKRAYVKNEAEGIPLLQGTHIPQIKPQGIKYIWKEMKNLEAYKVRKNWILVTCSGTIGRLSMVRNHWDGWAATNHLLRIVAKQGKLKEGFLAIFLMSIYGQIQFNRLVYGGVVDEIGEAGGLFNDILILKPKDKELENIIGSQATKAFDKRDQANEIEDKTIRLLERTLTESAGMKIKN